MLQQVQNNALKKYLTVSNNVNKSRHLSIIHQSLSTLGKSGKDVLVKIKFSTGQQWRRQLVKTGVEISSAESARSRYGARGHAPQEIVRSGVSEMSFPAF